MASSQIADTAGVRGKDAGTVVSPPTAKQDAEFASNLKGVRLLFAFCFACQLFSTYRAYDIYQDFGSWDGLNRRDKVLLAWGIGSTVVMAFFAVAYTVLEYRTRLAKKKDKM